MGPLRGRQQSKRMIEDASVNGSKLWDCTKYMEAHTGWMPVEVVAMWDDADACFRSPWKRRRKGIPDWRLGQRKVRQEVNRLKSSLDRC